MTRPLLTILLFVTASSVLGQSVLLNTRLHPSEALTRDQRILQLNLEDFFQTYESPGPVATLTIRKPVSEGLKVFLVNDNEVELMAYKLASGESYDDPYLVSASEFEWTEHTVEYQLFGDQAPITVANFKTYADDGAYSKTIVHRNESTGRLFGVSGSESFTPLPIIQAGGFRLYGTEEFLLEWVPSRPPIQFEETTSNVKGTIAMARTNALDSATSQFFINLENNSSRFGSAYSVFGELVDPENDQPILDDFANTDVYDLTNPRPNGQPNVFSGLPFRSIPLYTPAWDEKPSYVRISSVEVPDGDPSGISYSWDFVDDDEEVSDEEAASRASFDIGIDGGNLTIKRLDTATATIEVTGTNGAGESASFQVELVSFNDKALERYPTATILQGGFLEIDWYGTIYADTYPWISHENHGEQYVAEYLPDDSNVNIPFYYDYNLESFLYTTNGIYPSIYVYSLEKWVEYVESTGNGDGTARWFYVYDGESSGFVNESEL